MACDSEWTEGRETGITAAAAAAGEEASGGCLYSRWAAAGFREGSGLLQIAAPLGGHRFRAKRKEIAAEINTKKEM